MFEKYFCFVMSLPDMLSALGALLDPRSGQVCHKEPTVSITSSVKVESYKLNL